MGVIKKMRKQWAVWWPKGANDEFGTVAWGDPVEIKVRWEDREGKIISKQQEIVPSMSTVYVDRDMNIGDRLMLGRLDTNTPPNPMETRDAYEIQGWEKLPDFKAKQFLRIATL